MTIMDGSVRVLFESSSSSWECGKPLWHVWEADDDDDLLLHSWLQPDGTTICS